MEQERGVIANKRTRGKHRGMISFETTARHCTVSNFVNVVAWRQFGAHTLPEPNTSNKR